MPLWIARLVAAALEAYLLAGIAFAAVFLPRGIRHLDDRLRESPVTVRVLLFPGVTALWPIFLRRWLTGAPPAIERNAHRDAARTVERHP